MAPEDFRSNLREMARLVREAGAVPVLLTAPTSHERGHEPEHLRERFVPDLAQLVPLHRQYVEIVREVAEESEVVLCDLAAHFDSLSREERNRLFSVDGIHPTPEGDARIAELLEDCFESHPGLQTL